MRLWVSKSSEVPIRVQLEAQIILGILSNDLKAGQRLPSTRELARRHKIHSNTVSAAYRQLAGKGWVDYQRGSGVYVRERGSAASPEGNLPLDRLISFFLSLGLDKGQSLREIQARLRRWLSLPPPDHFLVVEPDAELRRIVAGEIEEATGARALGVAPDECTKVDLTDAAPIAMFRQAELVRASLPRDTYLITLRSRSVSESLRGEKLPPPDALIAIVSSWPEFLRWSHTMLVAGGVDPNALSFRDAREPGWEKGLRSTTFVITDSLTARQLPAGCTARVFRVVSDSSIAELRAHVEQFF
ncbi:MAG TPA: GntR family transcriptional regulator [Pyrinomonadaceae bacterium]|jgi:GntR family transcriptional regulator|nr:GntR family transcriptional regulator [Pyrinomonadaceae bacterium]